MNFPYCNADFSCYSSLSSADSSNTFNYIRNNNRSKIYTFKKDVFNRSFFLLLLNYHDSSYINVIRIYTIQFKSTVITGIPLNAAS